MTFLQNLFGGSRKKKDQVKRSVNTIKRLTNLQS